MNNNTYVAPNPAVILFSKYICFLKINLVRNVVFNSECHVNAVKDDIIVKSVPIRLHQTLVKSSVLFRSFLNNYWVALS